jgi:hypothetical protein
MIRLKYLIVLIFAVTLSVFGQSPPDAAELTALLNEFLDGASRNDPEIHNRFWADDLIYTGSTGRRVGKADIMIDIYAIPPGETTETVTVYTAEDIRIQQYDDTAIVAFRLVATTEAGGIREVTNYYNTGTFVKRDGIWQAVGWQATKIPKQSSGQ